MPRRGPFDEIVTEARDQARHAVRGWHGTIPARLVSVEQVRVMGGGVQALVVFDTLDGQDSYTFVVSPEDAREAARRLAPVGDHAGSGLFVP